MGAWQSTRHFSYEKHRADGTPKTTVFREQTQVDVENEASPGKKNLPGTGNIQTYPNLTVVAGTSESAPV